MFLLVAVQGFLFKDANFVEKMKKIAFIVLAIIISAVMIALFEIPTVKSVLKK